MRFNYKNTALSFLDNPDSVDFFLPEGATPLTQKEEEVFVGSLKPAFKGEGIFRDKVRYITRPFIDAYMRGKSKLVSVFDKTAIEETGTLIFTGEGFTNTYFYMVISGPTDDGWKLKLILLVFSKHKDADQQHLDVCIAYNDETEREFIWKGHAEKGYDNAYFSSFLVGLLTFIKYCDVETKIVAAGKKEKLVGEKYLNETKSNIEVLNSSWFTNIVRSEGFGVKGHFRMQPCGVGLSDRKLVYISDFQKNGYSRKARVLNQS